MVATVDIPLNQCVPSKVARPVAPGSALALAESMKQLGLLQPISVRTIGQSAYEIIMGGHRFEAAKMLGWPTIAAFIRDDSDLLAELALIDENLIRNELSPAQRAAQMARRKRIYEALHPETAHGAVGKGRAKSRQSGDSKAETPRYSKATADATGASERDVQRTTARGERLSEAALDAVTGTALDAGDQLDALAKLSPEKRTELIGKAKSGEKVNAVAAVKAEKREAKEKHLASVTLPTQKFNVIYADPPWRFEPYSRETGMDRAPENHYPTMTLEALLDLPVKNIAHDNCVLFLWTTAPMLEECFYVLEAWGFHKFRYRNSSGELARDENGKLLPRDDSAGYRSHAIWGKDRRGTGYWWINKHEILLTCVRGDIPAPIPGTQAESLINAAVREHSRKPVIFRGIIESLFPNLPKVELFARNAAPGWTLYGKEAPAQPVDETDQATDKHEASLRAQHDAEVESETPPLAIHRDLESDNEMPPIPDEFRRERA